jgi:cytochrome P450
MFDIHSITTGDIPFTAQISLLFLLAVVFCILLVLYRVYLSPLAKFPGPKLYAASSLPYIRLALRGEWAWRVLEWHKQYGPVVRVGPREISYISEGAWNDIYKAAKGEPQLLKDLPSADQSNGLFNNADDAQHQALRKTLSPVLSERGIRARESLFVKHVNSFMALLKDVASEEAAGFDIVPYFKMVAMDVIGDFLIGESFSAMASRELPQLAHDNYENEKNLAIGTAFNRNPFLRFLIFKVLPERKLPFRIFGAERWRRYSARDDGAKEDSHLITTLMKAVRAGEDGSQKAGVIIDESVASRAFSDFWLAGANTIARVCAGATHFLAVNPDKAEKLTREVREAFDSVSQIDLTGVNALKYLPAVISETLRLFPASPETQRRIVNKGGKVIDGQWVPEGTFVGVYHWAAGRYPNTWTDVEDFVPERWLSMAEEKGSEKYKDDVRGVMNPYNVGPRNCAGQSFTNAELRLILTALVWYFDIELADPKQQDFIEGVGLFGLVHEKRPLRVKLRSVRS